MAHASVINRYPDEQTYGRWGMAGSFSLHIFFVLIVLGIAWLTGIKSIEQLMKESGALAIQPPPPQDQLVEVELKDVLPPPPLVENPEFIRQIEKPKPPPPVIKKLVPKPKPKAAVPAPSTPAVVSKLVVGSGSFPRPGYPYEALLRHETGTVMVSIEFDSGGSVDEVNVVASSGHSDLDSSTRSFIREHWRDPNFAGQSATVPIQYTQ